jgi:hypothetical protein
LARDDAAMSDLLVVALAGHETIQRGLENLAVEWAAEDRSLKAALVAFLAGGDANGPMVQSVRRLASRHDLDFNYPEDAGVQEHRVQAPSLPPSPQFADWFMPSAETSSTR